MNWIDIAENLPIGGKTRITCCGRNKDAVISNTISGYSYYCFKCDSRLFQSVRSRTLTQLIDINKLNDQPLPIEIPGDFTTVIPVQHCLWLYKGGISNAIYTRAGIGWSDNLQRIIIPLFSDTGTLLYFQCRAVHSGQIPKYKNPATNTKKNILYRYGETKTRDRIIITEDVLSCIRVGKHTPACSILGTSTSDEQAGILSDYRMVSYWLDPDKAGVRGSAKGVSKLSLVTNTEVLTSKVDPKCLPDRVIRQILKLSPHQDYTYHGRTLTKDPEA